MTLSGRHGRQHGVRSKPGVDNTASNGDNGVNDVNNNSNNDSGERHNNSTSNDNNSSNNNNNVRVITVNTSSELLDDPVITDILTSPQTWSLETSSESFNDGSFVAARAVLLLELNGRDVDYSLMTGYRHPKTSLMAGSLRIPSESIDDRVIKDVQKPT